MNIPASDLLSYSPAVADLTDEQWQSIVPLLPEMLDRGPRRRGRPSVDIRSVLNSVMWVLRTRTPWSSLPACYVPYQTAHRYYLRWKKSGVLTRITLVLFKSDEILERSISRRADIRVNHIDQDVAA
jgi:transposase